MMKQNKTYELAREFLRKYPLTICWRLWQHTLVVERFIGNDEVVQYVFVAQENDNPWDVTSSCVVAITDKKIVIGRKRLLWGYFYHAITPDMYNDMEVRMGMIFGKIYIDTIKEKVYLSNIDPKALPEIEEQISSKISELKKEYGMRNSVIK